MTDILVQFHAIPEEMAEFIVQMSSEYNLNIIGKTYFPENYEWLNLLFVHDFSKNTLFSSKEVIFTKCKTSDDMKHALEKESELLRLSIGKLKNNILEESSLSTRCFSDSYLGTWKNIANRLKKIVRPHQGQWRNPRTGIIGKETKQRLSDGAVQFLKSGGQLHDLGGSQFNLS
ncbi:hypothetical protein [Rhizobium sp. LEGMi135b]